MIDPATKPEHLAEWARAELLALEHAKRVATDLGWCVDDLPGLVRTALDSYLLDRCERGTCTHDACASINATVFAPRPFATLAERAGLTMRVGSDGVFRVGPVSKLTDEWRFFIARNRDAIIAEITDDRKQGE